MTELEKKLFGSINGESQFTIIPLKRNEDSLLNPQPNFLVIDNSFDYRVSDIQYPDGNISQELSCTIAMRIVYRENLPEQDGKPASFREVVFDQPDNIRLPYVQIMQAVSIEALIQNKDLINSWFSMFSFRGCLEGFNVILDVERCQDFVNS